MLQNGRCGQRNVEGAEENCDELCPKRFLTPPIHSHFTHNPSYHNNLALSTPFHLHPLFPFSHSSMLRGGWGKQKREKELRGKRQKEAICRFDKWVVGGGLKGVRRGKK